MSKEILRLKPDQVRQLIKQGGIKFPGDPVDPPPIESKPDEITTPEIITPINTPVNTLGGIRTKRVDRRRFLWGASVLGSLVLTAGLNPMVDYLMPLPESYKKILNTPLTADELPQGWQQVESYPLRPDLPHNASILEKFAYIGKFGGAKVSSVIIILQMPGKEEDTRRFGIPMVDFIVFESSQKAQTASKQYQYPGHRSVSGIGDMAWVDFYNSPPNVMSRCFVVNDNVFITSLVKGDEQTVLNLSNSAVKYLARIGVIPKKS